MRVAGVRLGAAADASAASTVARARHGAAAARVEADRFGELRHRHSTGSFSVRARAEREGAKEGRSETR